MNGPVDASRSLLFAALAQAAMRHAVARMGASALPTASDAPPGGDPQFLFAERAAGATAAPGLTMGLGAPPPMGGGDGEQVAALVRDLVQAVAESGAGRSAVAADLVPALGLLQRAGLLGPGEAARLQKPAAGETSPAAPRGNVAAGEARAPPGAAGLAERAAAGGPDVASVRIAVGQAQALQPNAGSAAAPAPGGRLAQRAPDPAVGAPDARFGARVDADAAKPITSAAPAVGLSFAALAGLDSAATSTAAVREAAAGARTGAAEAAATRFDLAVAARAAAGGGSDPASGTIFPSAILNAAMIPGWPRPAVRDGASEKLVELHEAVQRHVELSEAELAAYLANFGLDEQLLGRLRAAQTRPDGLPKALTFLATLMSAAASVFGTLHGEIADVLEELARLLAAGPEGGEAETTPGARLKLFVK